MIECVGCRKEASRREGVMGGGGGGGTRDTGWTGQSGRLGM